AGKIKGCEHLLEWAEPVRNHIWHCAEICDGDVEELKTYKQFGKPQLHASKVCTKEDFLYLCKAASEQQKKDAKKQFGASIRSTWCSSPGTVETSSMDQKLQDIFFAAFILEESLLSFGSNQLNGTNPEFLDFDEDLTDEIFGSEFVSFVKSVGTKCTEFCGPVGLSHYSCTVGNLNHSNKINIKDAKKQFGASIRSTWCSSPGTVETSSMDQKLQDIFFAAFILEESLLSFGSNQLNGTNPEFLDFDEDLNFQIRHNALQKGNDFLFNGSNGENFIKIPQANLDQHSVVLGLAYNDLSDLLSNYSADTDEEGNKTRILDSIIMSAVIDPQPEFLTENVTLVFKNKKADRKNRTCVFWSFSKDRFGGWSSEGCQTNMIFDNQTECVCNHMTHFAVLMDFADNSADGKDKTRSSDEHGKILTILTQVGMALSLTGVVLTVIGYTQLTDRHSPLCHIRVSLTSCIGAGHVIFFAGIDATENKAVCVAVAALLQYFLMASFSWMLIEGIYIYLFVVKVYNIADKIFRYHGFCWGKVQYHS
ncbi:EGF, latrophilin seven transmembrane domain-containing protein 1, partial [Stylophora pistillata]